MTSDDVDQVVGVSGVTRLLTQAKLIKPWCKAAQVPCFAPTTLAGLFEAIRLKLLPKSLPFSAVRLADLARNDPDQLMRLITMILNGNLMAMDWAAPYRLVDLIVDGHENLWSLGPGVSK